MKNDQLYPYYIQYLNTMLIEGKISRGSFSLLSISGNSFDYFKYKFESDKSFATIIKRDKKIDDIISEED